MDIYFENNNYPENFKATIDRYELNEKYFKNKLNGVFIELGAIDGIYISNSKYFEDNFNWTGILIEPNLHDFNKLQKNRPNCILFNNIVSNSKDELDYIYLDSSQSSAVSGIKQYMPESLWKKYYENQSYYTTKIIPKSLSEIIKSTNFKYIDLLSLDVEGGELEVLESWDFSIPIKIILIEMTFDNIIKNDKCRIILQNNNYKLDFIYGRDELYILDENI